MPFRFVLCATDLSDGAAIALRAAAAVARSDEARLGVLLVMPDPLGPHALDPQATGDSFAGVPEVQSETLRALSVHVSDVLGPGGAMAELWVGQGIPYAVISERAEALGADLLVVGAHGSSGLKEVLLGSVTDRAVQHAYCSVLVARENPKSGGVLAATDFSAPARRAVIAAAEIARRRAAKVIVLHTIGAPANLLLVPAALPVPGMPPAPAILPAVDRSEPLRQAQARLATLQSELAPECEVFAAEGDPGEEIVRKADEQGVDLIVVGSVGRTGLVRMLLGSVSEEVVRTATCSVLVVR